MALIPETNWWFNVTRKHLLDICPGLTNALKKEFKLILRSFMSTYLLIILICARIFSFARFFFQVHWDESKSLDNFILFLAAKISLLISIPFSFLHTHTLDYMHAKSLPSSTRLISKGSNLILVLSQQNKKHWICPLIIIESFLEKNCPRHRFQRN